MSKIPHTFPQKKLDKGNYSCFNYNVGREYICPSSFEGQVFRNTLNPEYMYSEWFKARNQGRNISCSDIGCKLKKYNCQSELNSESQSQTGSGCSCNKFPLNGQRLPGNFTEGLSGGNGNGNLSRSNKTGGGCGCKMTPKQYFPNFNLLNPQTQSQSQEGGMCFLGTCLIGGKSQHKGGNIHANPNLLTDTYPRNTCNLNTNINSSTCQFVNFDKTRTYGNNPLATNDNDADRYVHGNYFNLCAK